MLRIETRNQEVNQNLSQLHYHPLKCTPFTLLLYCQTYNGQKKKTRIDATEPKISSSSTQSSSPSNPGAYISHYAAWSWRVWLETQVGYSSIASSCLPLAKVRLQSDTTSSELTVSLHSLRYFSLSNLLSSATTDADITWGSLLGFMQLHLEPQ